MKRLIISVVLVAFVVVFAVFQIGRCTRHGDTKFFFAAGEAVLAGGDPYVDSVVGGGYLYPPFFAALMVPFHLMPRLLAETLWFALNFASLVLLFAVSLYLLEEPAEPLGRWLRRKLGRLREGRFNWVVLATAVLSARYWMDNIGYGHLNGVLWALSLLGVYFALRRRWLAGGALLGGAVATKLITAPVLAYLFVRRRWAAIVVALVVVVVLLIGPAAVLGWERNASLFTDWYVKVVRSSMVESYYLGYDYNMSVHSLIYVYARELSGAAGGLALYRPAWFPYVRWAVTVLLVAPFFFPYLLRRRQPEGAAEAAVGGLQLSVIILAGTLLSPASWPSHFVATVFPYMAVLYVLRATPSRGLKIACYALLALSFIAHSLTSGDVWGAAMREAFYDLKCITWATLLLYAAAVALLLRECRAGRRAAA
ncbi:MAG: DUF2029 domain-containing protein [Candidatus Coatesbacteria bacterium]|nr:MAG: DUF2029 domain-containing protein [Candidatus Coatesbacteria bacterium]